MKKIFLYLYPIKEYNSTFEISDVILKQLGRRNPLEVLNECIQKRYRDCGYQIVYALYPDKNIYGINPLPGDQIIYTDITFEQASGYSSDSSEKQEQDIKYPNEGELIKQLGDFDEIVIGGFHFSDCVRRVAEYCYHCGFTTLVDLDLTDLFFNLYHKQDYFKINEYNPQQYKNYVISNNRFSNKDMAIRLFERNYNSPVYGFEDVERRKR